MSFLYSVRKIAVVVLASSILFYQGCVATAAIGYYFSGKRQTEETRIEKPDLDDKCNLSSKNPQNKGQLKRSNESFINK